MTESWLLKVGDMFAPEASSWPDGRFEYRFFSSYHMIQICEASITPAVLDAFANGKVHVALMIREGVIFFAFKIDGYYDWSDQAFSIQLVPEPDRTLTDLPANFRLLASLVLVNSNNGRVAAMRALTYSPQFSRALHQALKNQLETPFDKDHHDRVIAETYARYPTSGQLVKAASIVDRAGSKL